MTRSLLVVLALFAAVILPANALAVAPPTDRYIVVLKDSADSRTVARDHARAHGARVHNVYGAALEGYAATIPAGRLSALQRDPRVSYVEPDGVVHASATQTNPPWGLDRIDQRALPLSKSYTYTSDGSGVKAYVIDTGIRRTHTQFGGRAVAGADFVSPSTGSNDCDGHGTHVAGTIGGSTYGVARNVTLVAVRVLDCNGSGYWSWVIGGIDWVTSQHQTNQPAVANMSLGGGANSSVDTAVNNSINDGVTYSIAAGNSKRDACRYTPARVTNALTIGSTTSSDARSSFSNYGNCVDWFAPGSSILSAYNTSDTATATLSGTSMAAPHTAGAVALYLQGNPTASPATVRTVLFGLLTTGVVTSSNTANNHLLYTGSSTAPVNSPPTASFTEACADLACSFNASGSSDSDGTIASYAWTFGDGDTASGVNPPHTYATGGTYTVTLTVTDDSGATGEQQKQVTVTAPSGGDESSGGYTLTATGYKVKGVKNVDLEWVGATSTDVDVFRNGVKITTTANDGAYHETLGKGGGSYTYKVCEAGTSTCSNTSTAAF